MWTSIVIGLVALQLFSCSGRKIKPEPVEPTQTTKIEDERSALSEGKASAEVAKRNATATAEFHFSMAQAYAAEGNPDRAIEEYKLALVFDPDSAVIWTRLSAEFVKKGMISAAMESCKEALKLEATFIDARLMLAGLYSSVKENDEALKEYDRVLAQDPSHEEAMIYKAQVLSELDRGAEAVRELNGFLKKNPSSALIWYYLGRAEQEMEHLDEAEKAYKAGLELSPNFSQVKLSLGYLYETTNRLDEAKTIYRDLYDSNQNVNAANRLSTILLKQEKYEEAMTYLKAVQASDPNNLNALVKLGLVQMELKKYSEAIATFEAILKDHPDSDRIHYYLGSLHEETKNYDKAIDELKKIPAQSNLFEESVLHTAYLYKHLEQSRSAESFIREAMKKDPKVPSFHVFAASLREEQDDLVGAVQVLESAIKKFEGDEKIRYYLGNLYDKQGKLDKSIAQMEAILEQNPDHADALNYIGYTWTVQGTRLDDAEKLLKRAMTLKPNNGYIIDSWGWYLFVRGRFSEAIVELEKAVALSPDEPTILDHLGDVYFKANLREKALLQYEMAAKLVKDEDSRQKLVDKISNVKSELAKGGDAPTADEQRMPAKDADQSR